MKFTEIEDCLHKEIKNLYVINGNDSFLISEAVKVFHKVLVDGFDEFNFQKFDANELNENDYKNIFSTLPFCSKNKLIVIENVLESNKSLDNFINLPFYNVVVLLKNSTYKKGEMVDCNNLDNNELTKWIEDYFNTRNLKIDKKTISYIIDISNSDLGFINSEFTKVVNYLDAGSSVDIDIIKLLFTKNESYFVYNLTSAIDNRDKKLAFSILNSLTEENSCADIFTFMGSYFRKMFYSAIDTGDNASLANLLKTKPYAIQKAKEYVTKNGKGFYVAMYEKYVDLDFEIKSGKITPRNAIYSLIV